MTYRWFCYGVKRGYMTYYTIVRLFFVSYERFQDAYHEARAAGYLVGYL